MFSLFANVHSFHLSQPAIRLISSLRLNPPINDGVSSGIDTLMNSTGLYVQTVAPNGAGTTSGMLGYMFWAAECPRRRVCTVPPNSCEGGVVIGADTYNIPIPMGPLRQS